MRGGESMGNLMGGVAIGERRKARKGQGGFTLLDLSVSMIVIGLIGAGALQTYRLYAETKDYGNTLTSFGGLQTAMANFYYENGFYPCPADITMEPGDADYGLAVSPCNTGGPPGQYVSGGIPFKDLKIPMEFAIDGWKNKIVYTVTRRLTNAGTYEIDRGFLNIVGVDADGNDVTYTPDSNGYEAHYVIYSAGNDGAGAITAEGQPSGAACPDAGTQPRQNENCDGDSTFFHSNFALSKAENENYYDDIVMYATNAPSRIWVEQQNGTDIVTGLSIGIGTDAPTVALDVAGDILADSGNVLADRICDRADAPDNCFEPDMIGGTGENCGAAGIRGIRNGEIVCATAVLPESAVPRNCGEGQYVIGIDSDGNLDCQ